MVRSIIVKGGVSRERVVVKDSNDFSRLPGGIFETSLLAEAGVRLRERFAKESCGAVKGFPLFLFVYSGRGRQPTYMKRRREERGFPEIKVSRRSKKATSGSNRCFGHSSPCLLSCWRRAFGLTYYWI
ncbi:hypothetical protein VNO78_39902 [Psophocarpus tetragonolobus]|uniref:Uncharacterized protein n=1 Tax=Psophocarpus tetragonolobus TaxID=3891 RepID=A0AAN9N2X6_PSOTE